MKSIFKVLSLFRKDIRIFRRIIKGQKIPLNQLYIHDDETCPCGSRKVFKDCCKNKTDSGPIESPKPVEVVMMEKMRKYINMNNCCLHPDQASCQGSIKQAHALQNHKIISLLAGADNHVMMQDQIKRPTLIGNPQKPMIIVPFSKVSGNRATTQSCFCDLHDIVLFKPIEAGAPDFDPNNAEMILYAYKAFVFEYAKQIKLMSILRELFAERPQACRNVEVVKQYRVQCTRMEEFDLVKRHFDSEIMAGTHNGVETCVVTIPYQIGFANYAYIAPDYDLAGEPIKTVDAKKIMHRLAVTVLPEADRLYIMLSCLSSEEEIYHDLFEQIKTADLDKILYYFNYLLPLFSENLVLSEKLWDTIGEKGQMGLEHMANLVRDDQFRLSLTIGMALRNAEKYQNVDYSNRHEMDLFLPMH